MTSRQRREHQKALDTAYREGLKDGYDDGLEAGKKVGQRQATKVLEAGLTFIDGLRREWDAVRKGE